MIGYPSLSLLLLRVTKAYQNLLRIDMKKLFKLSSMALFVSVLSGCLASNTSPVGVNCDYSQGKPLWEMPLVCQGR